MGQGYMALWGDLMILSAQSIRRYGEYLIKPFVCQQQTQSGLTYGLSSCGYDIRIAQDLMLRVGEFALASSVEYFDLPTHLLMRICDKSTWARRGIFVQNTVAEPGWRGYLTLEITNQSKDKQFLHKGDPIAQVIFELLDEPTDMPYAGKYQDQPDKPIKAILEQA